MSSGESPTAINGESTLRGVRAGHDCHDPVRKEATHGEHHPHPRLHLLAATRPDGGETHHPDFQLPMPLRQAKNGVCLTAFDPKLLDNPDFLKLAAFLRQQQDACVWCTVPPPGNRQELREQIVGLSRMADLYLLVRAGVPIGFAIAKRPASPAWCHWRWVGVVVAEVYQRRGHGLIGLALLAAHLFDAGIDRVVGETFGLNRRMLALLDQLPGIEREGIRPGHVRVGDRFYDVVEYGITRERFQEVVDSDPRWRRLVK